MPTQDSTQTHLDYLRLCLTYASQSPPKPTNFRVGALLLDTSTSPHKILSTGYTLEMPGNVHAEQVCLQKLALSHNCSEEEVGKHLPKGTVLYTTVEPCNKRLSENKPCVERILGTKGLGEGGIEKVYVGVLEPETFVGKNEGRRRLEEGGVEVVLVEGLEKEILEVATKGHEKK